jgi:hypothetical protein
MFFTKNELIIDSISRAIKDLHGPIHLDSIKGNCHQATTDSSEQDPSEMIIGD